jgi:hypothetical protein
MRDNDKERRSKTKWLASPAPEIRGSVNTTIYYSSIDCDTGPVCNTTFGLFKATLFDWLKIFIIYSKKAFSTPFYLRVSLG